MSLLFSTSFKTDKVYLQRILKYFSNFSSHGYLKSNLHLSKNFVLIASIKPFMKALFVPKIGKILSSLFDYVEKTAC